MASKPHILIFPFMAQGHTIPLLDLSKALSSSGLKVTILTTPSNSSSIKSYISEYSNTTINLREIPFPKVEGLPKGCENMSQIFSPNHILPFFNATKLLRQPFEETIRDMTKLEDQPSCVISDSFLGWTNASCRSFGIPRLVFHGMGAFAMAVKKSLSIYQTHKEGVDSDGKIRNVKGVQLSFVLNTSDLPNSLRETNGEISRFFLEAEKSDLGSWGIIANTFYELEKDYVGSLQSLYGNETKTFCIGPLFLLYGQILKEPNPFPTWANWLNQQAHSRSTIFVSFGSQANLSEEQLEELAYGLKLSGQHYIWVVRKTDWNPPSTSCGRSKGLIVRDWVDQKWILAHRAIGGFVSHCGWNSTLESVSNGVPILAWPMQAEQHLNAKFLVEELKVGLRVPNLGRDGNVVERTIISKGVRELMGGEGGKQARENAMELGKMAKRAVQVGGSSYKSLDLLVQQIGDLTK